MDYNPPQETDCDSVKEYNECFTAYNEGYDAVGTSKINPYEPRTHQYFWWKSGYNDALSSIY